MVVVVTQINVIRSLHLHVRSIFHHSFSCLFFIVVLSIPCLDPPKKKKITNLCYSIKSSVLVNLLRVWILFQTANSQILF